MTTIYEKLVIPSPKRAARRAYGFEGFYPYYAGFPESFARSVIQSAALSRNAIIFDPWNGSGTTMIAAAELGYDSLGHDLNPVMVLVAKARLLPPSEASSLRPLAKELIYRSRSRKSHLGHQDSLGSWFVPETAQALRRIESAIRLILVDYPRDGGGNLDFDDFSMIASTYYVALFSVCRKLTKTFRTSNPTWLRVARNEAEKIYVPQTEIEAEFVRSVDRISENLFARIGSLKTEWPSHSVRIADSTTEIADKSVDLVLTSPPYCTRIDYAAATRVELSLLEYSISTMKSELSRSMMGSTKVPTSEIEVDIQWGSRCVEFLSKLREHKSKASSGYYFKVHADYFSKLHRSLRNISRSVKSGGSVIIVVQDSYYKDLHNDVPGIAIEMAAGMGLCLRRREDFSLKSTMAQINSRTRVYRPGATATESVLCFSCDV